MPFKDMTKEELIEYINMQDNQMQNLRQVEPAEKTNERFHMPYDEMHLLSGICSIGLIVTRPDGTIMSFNKTLQDMLGISIEEYKNTDISDLYADPDERRHLLNELVRSNTIRNFEINVKHKNGSLRTVLANVDYIELDDEHVLLTSLYDITQYKQLQEKERTSKTGFRSLFKNAPVGIAVVDIQGNLILSNNSIRDLLGYSTDQLRTMNVQNFYAVEQDRYELLALTEKLGYVRDFETMLKTKNGNEIPVLINTDKICFKQRKDILLTSVRDISNLKRVEDELRKERDFSNAVLDTAASLIVVLDRNGRIIKFNRTCEQITGCSFDEVKEAYLGDMPFLSHKITYREVSKLFEGAYPATRETVWLSRNGDKHLISWTNTVLLDKTGQIEYIIATGIDITKRKKAEEKLQKANQDLESRIKELKERTKEMNILNEMGEQLQSCWTVEEACAISIQYIRQICPVSHGALYIIDTPKGFAKAVEMWGAPPFTEREFDPMHCWAIRRSRQHLVDTTHPGLLCGHVTGNRKGQYLCIPLLINGEAIGMLHLNHQDSPEHKPDCISYEHKIQIVMTISEHIALALSNLKLKEDLRQQSIRDALTGLFNRRYMEETLERELHRATRENKSVGVLMLDIDHFKEFNDNAGHDAGDALLRELGTLLLKNSRGGDIVCRYGGEEFLIVLPEIRAEDARSRAEELRREVKNISVRHSEKQLPKCTISIGVAIFPQNGSTSDALFKAADDALYKAKGEGRDRIIMA